MKGQKRKIVRAILGAVLMMLLAAWPISYHPSTPLGDHYGPGWPVKVYLYPGQVRVKFLTDAPNSSYPNGDYGVNLPWLPIPALIVLTAGCLALTYLRLPVRRGPGDCVRCGYSLIGNTSGVCPECGTTIQGSSSA
jgi:hypothetical protein